MRRHLFVCALSLLFLLTTAVQTSAQTTSNQCIGVIYEDFTFKNVKFDSVTQLDSHQRYLRVRQTNFSMSGNPFKSDIVGDDEVAFTKLDAGQSGLRITRVILGANVNQHVVKRTFFTTGNFDQARTNLPGSARLSAIQGRFTLYTYPTDTTDYIRRTDSAAVIDIGSC